MASGRQATIGYFFSNHLGLGGVVRVIRGTVDVTNTDLVIHAGGTTRSVAGAPIEADFGGVRIGIGIRARF